MRHRDYEGAHDTSDDLERRREGRGKGGKPSLRSLSRMGIALVCAAL